MASNQEGEVKNRGLKRLPVGSDTHFKDGHVAEDDIEPPRGLKRISVSSNMDNSGLSNAEAVVVRKRQNKSLESNKPYYWDDKNNSAAKAKDNDFSESISGRRKGGIKKITPGGKLSNYIWMKYVPIICTSSKTMYVETRILVSYIFQAPVYQIMRKKCLLNLREQRSLSFIYCKEGSFSTD